MNIVNKEEEYRKAAKGAAGEEIVMEAIRQAVAVTGIPIKDFRNVIMEFPSLFGQQGVMTTEIDNILITPIGLHTNDTRLRKRCAHRSWRSVLFLGAGDADSHTSDIGHWFGMTGLIRLL